MVLPDFDGMTDEELVKALTPIVRSAINANYYRILGQTSLPIPIEVIERYVKLDQPFYGELIPIWTRKRVHGFLWKDCDVSNGGGITFDIYVWGVTSDALFRPVEIRNTIFTRKYWWKMYFLRSLIETTLKLKPESLRFR